MLLVISFFVADIKGCKTQLPGPAQPSEEMATLEHLSPFVDSGTYNLIDYHIRLHIPPKNIIYDSVIVCGKYINCHLDVIL